MIVEKVRETIKKHDLIREHEHIVIGLSGGPDSVCLFSVLMELSEEMDLKIHPVHVNHKMRPEAAERDQHYVEQLCKDRGLLCRTVTADCNALAKKLHMTSEEAGRKVRYDAFYQTAEEIVQKNDRVTPDMVKIAVAQNANDQAETILFRLLRGTGTDGLAGIAYERKERGFSVIRPILDIYRNEIEDWCEKRGLNPVRDHTNYEAIYSRNRIRLNLLPLLEKEYNENIMESLVRLGRIAASDKEYLWQETDRMYLKMAEISETCVVMDRQELSETHLAVRHRLMLRAFAQIGLEQDISEERLAAADRIIDVKQGPKQVQFPRGYRIAVAAGKVRFFRERQ